MGERGFGKLKSGERELVGMVEQRYTLGDRVDWFKGRLERVLGDGK